MTYDNSAEEPELRRAAALTDPTDPVQGEARGRSAASDSSDSISGGDFGAGLDRGAASAAPESRESTDAGAESGRGKSRRPRKRRRRTAAPAEATADDSGREGVRPAETATVDDGEGGSGETPGTETEGTRPRRRRGSRGGRRRKKTSSGEAGGPSATVQPDSTARSEELAAGQDRSAADPEQVTLDSDGEEGEANKGSKRRRSKRRSARRKKVAVSSDDAPDDDGPERLAKGDGASQDSSADEVEGAGRRKRRRGTRGGRKRKKRGGAVDIEVIPGEDDELPQLDELPPETELLDPGDANEPPSAGRRSRRKSKKTGREAAVETSKKTTRTKEVPRDQVIVVNAVDAEETRVAVSHDSKIVDLQMNVRRQQSYVNDIYRGRVVNLEEAIGAAFIDFGQGRNGFLHASDVMGAYGEPGWKLENLLTHQLPDEELADGKELDIDESDADEGEKKTEPAKKKGRSSGRRQGGGRRRTRPRLPIGDLLKKGSHVVVQVTKDAIGDKGPTLTTYISIPGRYLVLMPSLARTGVSRKIEDEKERRRLKRILQSLDIPEGMGVIVRTAGTAKTKTELSRDLEYLLAAWETFCKRLPVGRNPMPLYEESDVAIRTMRDLFSARTDKVVVDDQAVFERMVGFTKVLMPEHVDRIQLHDGARPLFHTYGVEQDFEKIFAHRVELPSGGSIVIDQTEALVAIDVNSGRTRDEGADFEDIALKTNLEAVPEIARQMRLRDLGGIIVLDFIDMARPAARRQVEKQLREVISDDRARSKIGRISQFGLLEMTRQRLGPGLSTLLYDTCSRCRGSGRQRTAQSRAQAILRRLGSALTLKGFSTVEVSAHPEVIDYLQHQCSAEIRELRERSGRDLNFKSSPDQFEDSVLHYLRADGREVRPGGRRKR